MIALALNAEPEGTFTRDNFPRGLLGFFLGQVLWRHRAQLARVPAGVLAAAMIAAFAIPSTLAGPILPVALLAFPAALVLGLRMAWLESRPLVWLGDRSYAIYLIHVPLRDVIVQHHGPFAGSMSEAVLGWGGFVALTLLLADLSLRLIENPARREIRRWWSRRGLRPAAA